MDINYVYDLFFSNKNLYCSGKCCALLSELAVVAVCQDSSVIGSKMFASVRSPKIARGFHPIRSEAPEIGSTD